ncbi:uncharacterized protein TNCV_176481, partial [Trichonephila clavipes]
MRSVGKGEAAAKVFCGVMNLPPPPSGFYEPLHALNNATEKSNKVSMALAAAETLSFNNGKRKRQFHEEPKKLESKTDNLNADKRDDLADDPSNPKIMVL